MFCVASSWPGYDAKRAGAKTHPQDSPRSVEAEFFRTEAVAVVGLNDQGVARAGFVVGWVDELGDPLLAVG